MRLKTFLVCVLLIFFGQSVLIAQNNALLKGRVLNDFGRPIELANIIEIATQKGTVSNSKGEFEFKVKPNVELEFTIKYVGFKSQSFRHVFEANDTFNVEIRLEPDSKILKDVEVKGDRSDRERTEVSVTAIDPKLISTFPSVSQDFNKILSTLPGVAAQNELSSDYAVRGGNFDENLIYVNDILIYRPFLVRSGQQEGLSFVNPDLTANAEFSAGGWQPRYGDKLSSVLNVQYKEPTKFAASLNGGLLGGSVHLEGTSKDKRLTHITGVRHKRLELLLNTLETEGQYLPRFTDVQSYLSYNLRKTDSTNSWRQTKIGLLNAYSRNRYNVIPAARESTFGTVQEVIRLFVGFDGQEEMEYDTYQSGVTFQHYFTKKYKFSITQSAIFTSERENQDLEAGYRLCDVGTNLGDTTFDQCIAERGLGTIYNYGRNSLEAQIYNTNIRNEIEVNEKNAFEFGLQYGIENINDQLNEYSFSDSADYVDITETRQSSISLESNRLEGYVQHAYIPDSTIKITYGVRLNYWSLNEQLLVSPRAQLYYKPNWSRDWTLKVAGGVYQQSPFYRELRNFDGAVNKNVKAQRSYHGIIGGDYRFLIWDRPFKLTTEAYVKYLTRVIPYDLDNVRIRYYAENDAVAYNVGFDMRLSGEFIKGAESWFSLGLLTSRENVEGDNRGFIRRPTDQRLNLGIFFQDHLPKNESVRMYLNLVYGTGLPFGPPRQPEFRAALSAPSYKRVDIGFSKILFTTPDNVDKRGLRSLQFTAEVLNIIAANNVISYIWIQDITGNTYAIPNTLSQRFVNFRVIARL